MQPEFKRPELVKAGAERDRLSELLEQVGRGDRIAFRHLYDVTSPRLYGLALRMLRRRDMAADVLQEAFVTVWRRANTFDRSRGTALAWLIANLRYRAIDRLRKRETRTEELSPELADSAASPYEWAATSEDGRRLKACLGLLDDKQRTAIVLAFAEGLTHEELAKRIDSPVGTVKSWIRRGLIRLKDCLGHG